MKRVQALFVCVLLFFLAPNPPTLEAQTEPPPIPAKGDLVPLPTASRQPESGASGAQADSQAGTLDAPGNFTATASASGSVSLSWSAVDGASYYAVKWWHKSVGSEWKHLTSTYGTSASQSGLTVGEKYYYYVCSVNVARFCEGISSVISVIIPHPPTATPTPVPTETPTPIPAPPPGTGNFSATASFDRVDLSWNAVSGADSYQIWKGDGRGQSVKWGDTAYATTSLTTYRDSTVTIGAIYSYAVRTMAGSTKGGWSSVKSVTIPANLSKPSVSVAANGATAVNVSWPAVTGATHYRILSWHAGLDAWDTLSEQHKALSYTHTGLTPGKEYVYAVRASNATGNGPWSDYAKITLPAAATATPNPQQPTATPNPQGPTSTPTPIRPTKLKINPDFPTSNALIWEGVDGAAGYEVQAKSRTSDHTPWQTRQWKSIGTPSGVNFSHNNLQVGTTYLYRVRALDGNGNQIGEWSFTEERTIPRPPTSTPTPLPTPTPTTAPPGRPNSFQSKTACHDAGLCYPYLWPSKETWLAWQLPSLDKAFLDKGYYQIRISEMRRVPPANTLVEVPLHTQSKISVEYFMHAGITPGKTYRYRIRAALPVTKQLTLYSSSWSQAQALDVTARQPPWPLLYPYKYWPNIDIAAAQRNCAEITLIPKVECTVPVYDPGDTRFYKVTAVPTATPFPTSTPRPTATYTPRPTATVTYTPRPTATVTHTPPPTATYTPRPTATATHTPSPTATYTPSPTATPLPVRIRAVPPDKIEISWEAVLGAVRYDVRKWDSSAREWLPVAGDNHTETSFTYQPAISGNNYLFIVYPVNDAGEWFASQPVLFLTMP